MRLEMADRPRIVLLAFDGFPLHCFGPSITPNLWRLGEEGGFAPEGGRGGLPSTTYPAFASLLTGMNQRKTGVRTTAQKPGAVPGWAGGARCVAPTIVHIAQAAGLKTAVVMGDHKLQKVLGLHESAAAWPPAGVIPTGAPLDAHGYPTNAAVRPHALEAASDPGVGLLFVHFNETDTLGHDHGPSAADTRDCVSAADLVVGELMAALEPDWSRNVFAVVSDHDMIRRLPLPSIDPLASRECAGLVDDWISDAAAAWLHLTSGVDAHMAINRLSAVPGVEAWRWREPNIMLLLAAAGRVFDRQHIPAGRVHGGIRTARTLAIVGGGHPAVAGIGVSLETRLPRLQDWAPTLAAILGLDLPDVDGIDLLEAAEMQSADSGPGDEATTR
jgi:Type I phosphodiesterase / nucleotide pyrophosphatase